MLEFKTLLLRCNNIFKNNWSKMFISLLQNCSKPITLGDIKYILNDNVAEINALADKSLKAYLDRNRDKIYYCPAADCSMFIHKNEISDTKWNCPLCKNCICIRYVSALLKFRCVI